MFVNVLLVWRKMWIYVGQGSFSVLLGGFCGRVWGGGEILRFFFIVLCTPPCCYTGLLGI